MAPSDRDALAWRICGERFLLSRLSDKFNATEKVTIFDQKY